MPVAFPTWRSEESRPVTFFERLSKLFSGFAWALLGVSALAAFGLLAGRFDHFVRRSSFFEIEDVRVVGASDELDRQIRERIAAMRDEGQDNLFLFNLDHALFYLEALPRVRGVRVEKEFPRGLRIEVEERRPVTAVSAGGLYWIDDEGVLFAPARPADVVARGMPPLTGVADEGARLGAKVENARLAEVLDTIVFLQERDPELAARFAEWHISPADEIVGILKQGVEVRFGRADPRTRLPALASVLARKDGIERLTYLDLSPGNQVVYF